MSATLTFSWSKPLSLASCTDCSFEYKYALLSTPLDGLTPTPVSFGTLSVTIPGLVNGSSYHYAVRTICGPVQSKWSYGTTVVCDTPPIDTPTPTPTAVVQTPTPTPTQILGSGCVTISQLDNYSQINCLGQGPYNVTTTSVTATLDAIAPVAVTVRVYGTRNVCYGGQSPDQFDIIITAGSPSNYVDISTYSVVDCGQGTCEPETVTIDSYEVLTQGYSLCEQPTPTPTSVVQTPTPTPTLSGSGQCYVYQVQSTVSQSNYGVRYTPPGLSSRDELFNQMLAIDGGSYSEFRICSTVDPTLLDYTLGYAVGVGSVEGITRTGPLGLCTNNFDCSPSSTNYCCDGGECIECLDGFSSFEDCQAACSGT